MKHIFYADFAHLLRAKARGRRYSPYFHFYCLLTEPLVVAFSSFVIRRPITKACTTTSTRFTRQVCLRKLAHPSALKRGGGATPLSKQQNKKDAHKVHPFCFGAA